MQSRFYWPGMRKYLNIHVATCKICGQCKVGTTPKAPLVSRYNPQAPMEYIALDIAYMPVETEGYRYLLIIGDLFSKYIEAIPLKDQTASTIVRMVYENCLCRHGYPKYLLTDYGSNVSGQAMDNICEQFEIKKKQMSGYHSQGNGFEEWNIRSIGEIFRTSLLETNLPQIFWREILPTVTFTLNSSGFKDANRKYSVECRKVPQYLKK